MDYIAYSPCDVCGKQPENDMSFSRYENGVDRQYSLCDKHLPNNVRTYIWRKQLRIGRVAATLLGYGIGLSGCYKCGTPWDLVRSHTTDYSEGSGCFPLCEKCWGEMTPKERMPYYEKLIRSWGDHGKHFRDQIVEAVLAGK